jgi:hypothetical protein
LIIGISHDIFLYGFQQLQLLIMSSAADYDDLTEDGL